MRSGRAPAGPSARIGRDEVDLRAPTSADSGGAAVRVPDGGGGSGPGVRPGIRPETPSATVSLTTASSVGPGARRGSPCSPRVLAPEALREAPATEGPEKAGAANKPALGGGADRPLARDAASLGGRGSAESGRDPRAPGASSPWLVDSIGTTSSTSGLGWTAVSGRAGPQGTGACVAAAEAAEGPAKAIPAVAGTTSTTGRVRRVWWRCSLAAAAGSRAAGSTVGPATGPAALPAGPAAPPRFVVGGGGGS